VAAVAAVSCALGAAAAIGVATALQHAEARQSATRTAGDVRLLLALVRRRRWLLAGAIEVLGLGLQALALRLGSVTLVQPLVVAALPVAVLASVPLGAAAVTRRVLSAVALCTVALAVLGAVLPSEVPSRDVAGRAAALAGIACLAGALGLLALHRSGRSWALGAAAGIPVGAGAVLLALIVRHLQHPLALLTSWPLYALLVVGAAGLALSQSALQADAIAAPLTALTVVEPVIAVVLGVTLLHEQLPTSALSRALALAAGAAVVAAVVVLASDREVEVLHRS
jgi:hypothetical protein